MSTLPAMKDLVSRIRERCEALKPVITPLLSYALLLVDLSQRLLRVMWAAFVPWVPLILRMALVGVTVAGSFQLAITAAGYASALLPREIRWEVVMFTCGIAVILSSISLMGFLLMRTVTQSVLVLMASITDLPRVFPSMPSPAGRAMPPEPAGPKFREPPPKLRDGGGTAVSYDEMQAFLMEHAEDLRTQGLSDENIRELIAEAKSGT